MTNNDAFYVPDRDEQPRSECSKYVERLEAELDAVQCDRDDARGEVARLTAVVQGVREGIEIWASRLHGIRWEGEPVSDQLREVLDADR